MARIDVLSSRLPDPLGGLTFFRPPTQPCQVTDGAGGKVSDNFAECRRRDVLLDQLTTIATLNVQTIRGLTGGPPLL